MINDNSLKVLIENELYKLIIALSDDEIPNVTIKEMKEGIQFFILEHELSEKQIRVVIEKIWDMFKNKNENLSHITKEKFEDEIQSSIKINKFKSEKESQER